MGTQAKKSTFFITIGDSAWVSAEGDTGDESPHLCGIWRRPGGREVLSVMGEGILVSPDGHESIVRGAKAREQGRCPLGPLLPCVLSFLDHTPGDASAFGGGKSGGFLL